MLSLQKGMGIHASTELKPETERFRFKAELQIEVCLFTL